MHNNQNLTFHLYIKPGDGGKDSVGCAEIIFNMYKSYFQKQSIIFKTNLYEIVFFDSKINDFLQKEIGVHRVIRNSPFDKTNKRHTSFVSVNILIKKENKIEISLKDIRVDCYRAQGKGGQHVNKTESAVRLTHIPTGLQAVCQDSRSQLENRKLALENLTDKITNLYEKDQRNYINSEIQIRSYFLSPSFRIVDHLTNKKITDKKVLEGELDLF